MPTNLLPVLSYVLISTFTPGPSNISSASLGVLHGYKNTLNYQSGLALGVFIEMFLSGLISKTLLSIFPAIEPVLRVVGAAYILYLAFSILRASYTFTDQNTKPLGFASGLTLQLLNPKLVVYAFTLFSMFLASVTDNVLLVFLAAMLLAIISFGATSTWAMFGTAIKNFLQNPRLKTVVNILLSLSLVYAAASLVGIV
jgi:cysteine/O-acetylserine efflux protein